MRYVIAVADELSFTRAAARCNVSQPPLSRAIRDLETEIGVQLFERDTHSVRITPAGETLVSEARLALATIEKGIESARQTASGLRGTLKLGFGGSTVYSLLPALIRRFRADACDVDFEFCPMPVLNQIDALRSGEIDLGLLRLPIFDEMIETAFVHGEPLVVALPEGHPLLENRGAISIADLESSRFITYEPTRGFNFHSDLLALCRLAKFNPEIRHQVATTEAVVGIVACGEGVAILPASAERLRMEGVAFRPLETGGMPDHLREVRFGLAWCKDTPSATALRFISRMTKPSANRPDPATSLSHAGTTGDSA
ncbi:LysR family transcriptional regulator [Croceibacterium atlanticum]|nr:LysR family transcriptional regulator [Croceibacterium atlanticum]